MTNLDVPFSMRCGLEISDRIALAPLTNCQSHADGILSDDEYRWLMRRAKDGFRWISTCATYVSDEGKAWVGQLGIANDRHAEGLRRLTDGLRATGAAAVVQLYHGGAKADQSPGRPLSTVDGGPANSRGATVDDLERVVEDFVSAARRAEQAGFHGVEIHGANGYLFTQFLSPRDNPRDDEYGGELPGRARLLRQTMAAIRAAVAPSFAVGVRLSPVDLRSRRGLVLDDSLQVARWLVEDGADFIHLSLAAANGEPPFEPDRGPVARAFRAALPADIPVFAAGGVWTLPDALTAREAGVDVVVLGRAAIAHPDWPSLAHKNGWSPFKPPWTVEHLRSVDVAAPFVRYMQSFKGMVVDDANDKAGA